MASKFTRAAVLGAALLGCSALTAPSFAEDAKTITGGFDVGPGGFQGNFNPMAATSGFTWLSIYFEPLVTYDAGLSKFVPSLASSWEVSADQKTYTFKLVEETWHDGEAFDSADVKFTIELNKNPDAASVLSARLKTVAGVETPDPRTVVVTLSEPNAAFLDSLTKVLILPEHAVSKIPAAELSKNAWWSTSPVGTGPFKFTKYETDRFVELAADEDYRDGRPKVDRLINRYFESSAAAVAALRAGEIQFSYVETDDVPTFAADSAYKVIEGTSYVANYIGFNTEVALWKDLKVRQAVMHAIDRKAIIESLYKGAATEANCGFVVDRLVPQGLETFAYDPEKAKALLAEAGWDEVNGDKPIVWLTYYTNPLATNVMAAIQAMLAEVGINVVPRAVDTATYNGIILAKTPKPEDFPLVYAGLGNGPDPSSINIGLNETQIPPVGNNFLHIRVPELNAALDTALAETDDTKRDARYQDVCKAMNAHLPWAPMWVTNRYGVASVKLKDFVWTPAPGGGPFDTDAEKWSLAE